MKEVNCLMSEKFLMGNEAIAMAALHNGVDFVAGYPGTPSSEILETAAKNRSRTGTVFRSDRCRGT